MKRSTDEGFVPLMESQDEVQSVFTKFTRFLFSTRQWSQFVDARASTLGCERLIGDSSGQLKIFSHYYLKNKSSHFRLLSQGGYP